MTSPIRRLPCVIALCSVLFLSAGAAHANLVLQWNEIAVRTLTSQTPALNPFAQARFAAIVQLAVFEAVNSITGDYQGYLGSPSAPTGLSVSAPVGSSPEAAATAAAYKVLITFFGADPATALALNNDRAASLALIPDGAPKTNGIATGEAAALAVMAVRVGDGSSPLTNYLPAPAGAGDWDLTPGCPTTTGGIPLGGILFNWGDVKPFGIALPASGHWYEPFRPVPPPDLGSTEYAKDFAEVKSGGSVTATAQQRSADRTINARFYAALGATPLFHTVARQLAAARGDSLSESARNLALISSATNDALIASFKTKYHYNFWRPYTAIRAAADDGNDKTTADLTWAAFLPTPCFPSYPSNHASGSNAAMETLRRIYGPAGHAITLSFTVPVIGVTTLKYTKLQDIGNDVDDARIHGGMHFRFDQVAGVRLGREVATYVYKNNLQPIHP
jgi:hypothetical protein